MGTRRRARECALQILYGIDWSAQEPGLACELFWDAFAGERPAAYDDVRRACDTLVEGVIGMRAAIDAELIAASHNWKLDRMSVVDRNILRIGTYELLWLEDVPRKVVLNEAIEISKKYGNLESSSFVNGVLHQISLRKPDAERARPARRKAPAGAATTATAPAEGAVTQKGVAGPPTTARQVEATTVVLGARSRTAERRVP